MKAPRRGLRRRKGAKAPVGSPATVAVRTKATECEPYALASGTYAAVNASCPCLETRPIF